MHRKDLKLITSPRLRDVTGKTTALSKLYRWPPGVRVRVAICSQTVIDCVYISGLDQRRGLGGDAVYGDSLEK